MTNTAIVENSTKEATTSDSQEDNKPRRRRMRLGVTTMLAALAVFGAAGALTAAPASASISNQSLDAACGHGSVTAQGPNLRYTNYTVFWFATLYRYTSAGWKPYMYGSAEYDDSQDWMISSYTFSNLPGGYYYQVRDTFNYAINGRTTNSGTMVPVTHTPPPAINQLTTSRELMWSTSSYCYIG